MRAGERRYVIDPRTCYAVQDLGRGIWPYRSFWNWGVATGCAGDVLLGVNFGAKWTTGTGSNENGILWNGRLHKIMEDLRWEYDAAEWRSRGASSPRTRARSTSCSSPSSRTRRA